MSTLRNEALPAAEHRTVARVMSIMELVLSAEPNGMRLTELSAAIDAPKSSVHGLVKGLVSTGYFREERGRYLAGPAISTLLAVGPTALTSIWRHALEQLTARWNETSMLATLVGDSLVYLDCVESTDLIRAAPEINKRLGLWPRAAGKCMLAFMPAKRLDAFYRRHAAEIGDEAAFRQELDTVRESRVGLNFGGAVAGHIGIASPIVVDGGTVTMVLTMAGPSARMEKHLDDMSANIREIADGLSGSQRDA